MAVNIMRRHFSVQDYHCMRLAGILTEADRVELKRLPGQQAGGAMGCRARERLEALGGRAPGP